MIALEDCIALCGLTESEVAAVAEHEHLPEVAAAMLGRYLLARAGGVEKIRVMIVEDIRMALSSGQKSHAAELMSALRHLLSCNPGAI